MTSLRYDLMICTVLSQLPARLLYFSAFFYGTDVFTPLLLPDLVYIPLSCPLKSCRLAAACTCLPDFECVRAPNTHQLGLSFEKLPLMTE